MVTKTLFLEFFLILLIFCYKHEVSENVKMVVVFGIPSEFSMSAEKSEENWADCLDKCWKQWDCVLVFQLVDVCTYYEIQEIQKVTKLDSSYNRKVGIKISLPSDMCPRDTEAPPLFGNASSSLIITNGSDNYYKSEITETSETWNFNYSIHECLTDIPEDYDSLEGTYTGNRYQMNLTSPFYLGEMFFMKGKTPKYRNQLSISFVKFPEKDYALHIRLYFGYGNLNITDITVWKNDVEVKERTVENLVNPYGCEEDFEIRINASETEAYIYMNDYPVIQYTLEPTVPMSNITNFVINDSNLPDQQATLYYVGWTGICEYVPL